MPRKRPGTENTTTEIFALKTLVATALTEAAKDKDFIERVLRGASNVMRTFGYTEQQTNIALQRYFPSTATEETPGEAPNDQPADTPKL